MASNREIDYRNLGIIRCHWCPAACCPLPDGSTINWKPPAQRDRLAPDPRFAFAVAGGPILSQAVQHLDNHAADVAELGSSESSRRAGRRAEPDAGGHRRLLRIQRYAVLVACD